MQGSALRLLSTLALIPASTALLASTSSPVLAAEFDIPPGAIQLVEFESEAPIENIRGISTEARGQLTFDPKDPTRVSGRVLVPVASLRTGNTTRDGHLQQPEWLDAKAHPDLVFAIDGVRLDVQGPLAFGATASGRIDGILTIKGKSKRLSIPVKVAYLEASEKLQRVHVKGNALRVKGETLIELADFGVVPPSHLAGVKVAEAVTIKFAITAVER